MDAKIVLTVDASGAISKVQDFNSALSQLQNTTRTSSGLMGQFDSAIGSLTAGFTISRLAVDAYYKIVRTGEQILKDSIEHALKASASQEALKATLDITGRTIQGNLKHYLDFAHAQMMVTTYSHDEVEAVQALLLQLTNLDQKGLDAATKGAIGLAAIYGGDLLNYARMISLAFEGNYMMISRLLPQVRMAQGAQEKHAALMDGLSKAYQRATAEAGTYEGQVKNVGKWIKEIEENLGTAVINTETFSAALTSLGVIGRSTAEYGVGPLAEALEQVFSRFAPFLIVLAGDTAEAAKAMKEQAEAEKKAHDAMVPFLQTLAHGTEQFGPFSVGLFRISTIFDPMPTKINETGAALATAEDKLAAFIREAEKTKKVAFLDESWTTELVPTDIPAAKDPLDQALMKRKAFWGNLYKMDQEEEKRNLAGEKVFSNEFMQDLTRGFADAFMKFKLSLKGFADFFVATIKAIRDAFVKALADMVAKWIIASLVLPFLKAVFTVVFPGPLVALAKGFEGVVSRPTPMLVGEAGPEYVSVTPLRGGSKGGGGGTTNVYFTIHAIDGANVEAVTRQRIVPILKEVYAHGGL